MAQGSPCLWGTNGEGQKRKQHSQFKLRTSVKKAKESGRVPGCWLSWK